MSSAAATAAKGPVPLFSIRSAITMHTRATTEPTEMSIPPVTITMVSPQPITIRPALLISRFRNIWGLAKPLSLKTTMPTMYISRNSPMVIIRRKVRLLNVFFSAFCRFMQGRPLPPPDFSGFSAF